MRADDRTPLERYQEELANRRFHKDPLQAAAVRQLQNLYDVLLKTPPSGTLLERLLRKPRPSVRGLYLWGGTGRGKTWLMDSFYETLPFAAKRRVHFHRFMQDIHEQLQRLPRTPDPLVIVAKKLSASVRLLCLDEFQVTDIADAMLLGGLLQALFQQGITLVATSNTSIDELYLNGLQRDRFLFAIDLLNKHTREFHLRGENDFRFEVLEESGSYRVVEGDAARTWLRRQLERLQPVQARFDTRVEINRRYIPTVAEADDVAWVRFMDLCEAPLWAADYLELARRFHTLIIEDIPLLDESKDDVAKRFMHLIDALYDHGVKTVITARVEPEALYQGRYLTFAFQRTLSRLTEMGTQRYLAKRHRC